MAIRRSIIDDFRSVLDSSLDCKQFLSTRATSDLIFEDPLERFDGAEDFCHFIYLAGQMVDGVAFKVHQELHSAHEILVDWDIEVRRLDLA